MGDQSAEQPRERVRDRYAEVTFTIQAAPGIRSAIIRAVKPGR